MGFRNILKGKRRSQGKMGGTRTALEIADKEIFPDIDAASIAFSEVSSLGNSVYTDSNGITSDGKVKTVTKESPKRRSKSRNVPIIYMFPKIWQERTAAGLCRMDGSLEEEYEGVDEASIARRKKIFEEDLDADAAWDTTMDVDEDRYRSNGVDEAYPVYSFITCLACV